MALCNRYQAPRRRPLGLLASESEIVIELTTLIKGGAPNLAPKTATLQQLRSLAGGAARLWCDISMTAVEPSPDSEHHSNWVALFSLRIARLMGLSQGQTLRILRAAYLHDVGKIAVSESIMRKPGRLAAEERAAMQAHSIVGCELLSAFLSTEDLAGIVLSHHERYDGDGYPNGLQGRRIPLEARVLAIADSLDAMMSRRPYCESFPFSVARKEVIREAGGQFDPSIVEVMVREGELLGTSPSSPGCA